MVMLRRGRWKYIHTPSDPDQLFDLESDPLELVNVASEDGNPVVSELGDEVRRRWDLAALEQAVRESQQARLAVFSALQQGKPHPWDYEPARPTRAQSTRDTMDVAERDQQSRYPPLPAP